MVMDDIVLMYKLLLGNIIAKCPRDKSNLISTIEGHIYSDGYAEVFLGGKKAPYVDRTNDYWKIDLAHKKVNGKLVPRTANDLTKLKSRLTGGVNPNLEWFDDTVNQTFKVIASLEKGVVMFSDKK